MTTPDDIKRRREARGTADPLNRLRALSEGAEPVTCQPTPEAREAERKATFVAFPAVRGFLGTLLEDLQLSENDEACEEDRESRDVGTIYDCPDSTYRAACAEVAAFYESCDTAPLVEGADDVNLGAFIRDSFNFVQEHIGSDLYLERYGHGAGFTDRTIWSDNADECEAIGAALSAAVAKDRNLETYVGDDGAAYICGME